MHGKSVEARLRGRVSERSKKIPESCLDVVKEMLRDAYLEGYDLGYGYGEDGVPIVDGKTDYKYIRDESWESSDALEELDELADYRKNT